MNPAGLHATPVRRGLWLVLVFLVALWLRLGPQSAVQESGDVWFNDPDACFHMRRVHLLLARGGTLPETDAWSNVPEGVTPYVAPGLDYLIYGVCRVLGVGPEEESRIGRVAALVPPILGAFVVVPVWWLARRLFPPPEVATLAGLVLALLPGHILYTRYAMTDHHVLESLLVSALAVVGLARPRGSRGEWALAAAGAACLTGLALSWNGFTLYVLMWAGISALAAWRRPAPELAFGADRGARVLLCFLPPLALVVAANPWLRAGVIRYDAPSLYHLAVAALAALWCALAARVYRRTTTTTAEGAPGAPGWFAPDPWRRALFVLGAGLCVFGIAAVLPGPLRDAAGEMFQFPGISVNRVNLEGRPVWHYTNWIFDYLSGVTFLLPLALYAVCEIAEHQGGDAETLWHWAGWTLAAFILAVWMTRFTYLYAPFLALAIAGTGWAAAQSLGDWHPWLSPPPTRATIGLLLAFACVLPTLPTAWSTAQGDIESGREREHSLRALRELTPEPGDWRRPEQPPEWAFLAPWHYGHALKFWARRPTVSDNMGVGFEKEFRWSFETEEAAAWALLRAWRVRYVLVGHDSHLIQSYADLAFPAGSAPLFASPNDAGEWQATDRYWRRVAIRLVYADGSAVLDSAGGLAHFRHVQDGPGKGPDYKVFEVVAGARLAGTVAAGASVKARCTVAAGGARTFLWERSTHADGAGAFTLVVPYFTGGAQVPGLLRLETGERTVEIPVSEAAVRDGSTVDVRFGE